MKAKFASHKPRAALACTLTPSRLVWKEGNSGSWYSPTLLRELLLSESEGMMDKTL